MRRGTGRSVTHTVCDDATRCTYCGIRRGISCRVGRVMNKRCVVQLRRHYNTWPNHRVGHSVKQIHIIVADIVYIINITYRTPCTRQR